LQAPELLHALFEHQDLISERFIFVAEQLTRFRQERMQASRQTQLDKLGPIEMQQLGMKSPGFSERLDATSRWIFTQMRHNVIVKRMEDPKALSKIIGRREEIALIEVATKATIDEVCIRVIAAGTDGLVMIDGEFTAGLLLGHAAIAASTAVPLTDFFVSWVGHRRHSLTPSASRVS
jgi:hypothetical protein